MNDFDAIKTFGSSGTGNSQFSNPGDMAIDERYGNIAICDSGNNRISLFKLSGWKFVCKVSIYGNNLQYTLSTPTGIAYDNGYYYVSDYGNHTIVLFKADTLAYVTHWGTPGTSGSTSSTFYNPHGIAISPNNIFICDWSNDRVMKFDKYMSYVDEYSITKPIYIAYDHNTQSIWVTCAETYRVHKLTVGLKYVSSVAVSGTGNSNITTAYGIGIASDKVYVADGSNEKIVIFGESTLSYLTKEDVTDVYGLIPYKNTIITSLIDTSDQIKVLYNYNPKRSFTSTSEFTFQDDPLENPWSYDLEDLVAGATGDYTTTNRWLEEDQQTDSIAWEKE